MADGVQNGVYSKVLSTFSEYIIEKLCDIIEKQCNVMKKSYDMIKKPSDIIEQQCKVLRKPCDMIKKPCVPPVALLPPVTLPTGIQ